MPDFLKSESSPLERQPLPERGSEAAPEAAPPVESGPAEERVSEAVAPTPVVAEPSVPVKPADPVVASIETILSEDMTEHFRAMPPALQAKFRQKGDETVSKLSQMVNGAVIKAKEVLKLIVNWIKLIPGVNKYFLEQESKIKTDKILELHKRQHGG
jgi:hypothetical protein